MDKCVSCGHGRLQHIYGESACRPGWPCDCRQYVPPATAQAVWPDDWRHGPPYPPESEIVPARQRARERDATVDARAEQEAHMLDAERIPPA